MRARKPLRFEAKGTARARRRWIKMPKLKGSKLNRETGKYEMPASLLERAESAVIERAKAREPERGEAAERSIGRYVFEGGAFVRISASSSLDIETVLEMVDTLVNLKRKELTRKV